MAERIWQSPRLFAKFDGDQEASKRLERRARTCVGYLFDQLRPGQTYRVQSWNYADGSRIKAHVWRDVLGERARVEIYTRGGFQPQYNDEMPASGWFVRLGYPRDGAFRQIFPRKEKRPVGKPWVQTYGPWQNSEMLGEQEYAGGVPSQCNIFLTRAETLPSNRGSQYSGKMRELVQLAGATSSPIPFNFGYVRVKCWRELSF